MYIVYLTGQNGEYVVKTDTDGEPHVNSKA